MDLFSCPHYKEYLTQRLDDPTRGGGRGARARLSAAMKCQTAYTAQILNGAAHLSLEQAEATNAFFQHTEEEADFFILLVEWARAGSPSLKRRFERRIRVAKESRLSLKNRLGVGKRLTSEQQSVYYSGWYYAAAHVLISLPAMNTVSALAERLNLSREKMTEVVSFLCDVGLLTNEGGRLDIGTGALHLGSDSPFIIKHHQNWRLQAIRAMEKGNAADLHYSSITTLSKADAETIRESLVQTIQRTKKVIRDSADEAGQCFSIDFFAV